jgi:predicted component of type VI protein secretion system
MDQTLIKQINQRIREELRQKEIEVVQYGLTELEQILGRRHQDMASLQLDLKGLIAKFQNRLKMLKSDK